MVIDPTVWQAIKELGFPIVVVIAIGYALYKKWFVSGPAAESQVASLQTAWDQERLQYQAQLEYAEARRKEERATRIAVEQRLTRNLRLMEQQAELLKQIPELLRSSDERAGKTQKRQDNSGC